MANGPDSALLRSPLHDRHVGLGAKFAEFGGWEMPLEYAGGGVLAEHKAVREAVGLFDVSHLGKAVVRGAGALAYVNRCLSADLDKIGPGQAQYTLCCDESGGVVDDLIAYVRADDDVFLVPNAANTTEVVRRLAAAAPDGVEVIDQHRDFAVLAVQGPHSDAVLDAVGLPTGHDYMSFASATYDDASLTVCRTGYTGERGYELVVPAGAAATVWDAVMLAGEEFGLRAAGLGARDTLRTEMGYPLHGQDLSLDITPVMGRAAWAVGWDKAEFWGKPALVEQRAAKTSRVSRGLVAAGRGIPRPGMTVRNADGTEIGEVTSGTFSPSLRKGIALALVDRGLADGQSVSVDVRGRTEPFTVTKPPFVSDSVR
ncbi:glycine cleavage system aminomethyltransferase GcvT [Solicola gregarius]|uniref:Aminomethyltransferase n=1 Tax=Solicola gregarius TaxID=2908642 RepID=A0AA46THW2_9ACTN|nr:glycine cleavage system aminomethyltransferase GcvT [Solicola gregarius]UYM05435.1 glycine cleavage system aminomethyltransferase GcvT [Solicola gregarius]